MSNKQIIVNAKIYAFLIYQFANLILGSVFMPLTIAYIYLVKKIDKHMISLIVKTSFIASFEMLKLSIWATETLYFPSFKEFTSWQKWKAWELTEKITNSYRAAH